MTSSFYKNLLDPAVENNSDVSEIGAEDLENIVKGVDDIDDALFGFKPKQQDSQDRDRSPPVARPSTPTPESQPIELPSFGVERQAAASHDRPRVLPSWMAALRGSRQSNLGQNVTGTREEEEDVFAFPPRRGPLTARVSALLERLEIPVVGGEPAVGPARRVEPMNIGEYYMAQMMNEAEPTAQSGVYVHVRQQRVNGYVWRLYSLLRGGQGWWPELQFPFNRRQDRDIQFLYDWEQRTTDIEKNISTEAKPSDRPKSAVKKQSKVSDFPEEDLLADISLSDDDFYDLGKKSPSAPIDRDKLSTVPKTLSQDKLTKSKKIANLFGLDDEDDVVTESKKKQESAADWLGIKDSPVKTLPKLVGEENLGIQTPKTGLTDSSTTQDPLKISLSDVKVTPARSNTSRETDFGSVSAKRPQSEVKSTENAKTKPDKSGENIFDLLGDKNEQPKSIENPKDKKSAIFDELFGDSGLSQKSKSRRNSAVKTPETFNIEHTGTRDIPPVGLQDDSSTTLGQYIPSAGTSKRPAMGRRRETTSSLLATQPSIPLFQDDWLVSSNQPPELKKETTKSAKADIKTSGIEVHEGLPTWLGGSDITPVTKLDLKQSTKALEEKQAEKPATVVQTQALGKTTEAERPSVKDSGSVEVQVVDTVREALATSSEATHQTSLALQRTETQLLAALQLQTTQSGLSAVCARQRSLLDNQEKQLTQLVARQTDRQTQMEKQLTAQQYRIQQLLEVLAENIAATQVDILPQHEPAGNSATENNQKKEEMTKDFEREIHKATFENEELRLRMTLMEKHYKMEYESLQIQHRREIESWEEKHTMQKELTDQICEDYKERITRLKENQEELLAQHNERVQRLREEKAEDMRQLMDFHKTTLEQMMIISKLVPPVVREEQKTSFQTWKPLDATQLTEKEEDIMKRENTLKALQEKLEVQKTILEKRADEIEDKEDQEKVKYEEMSRQLNREKNQLKYQQQQLQQEKKRMEEQYHEQRKQLEEMQERAVSEQTQLATEKLKLAEEKAKLDALAKLQGVSGTATFDVLKSKAEVHGALEAARSAELQAVEERKKLREKERLLDTERWRLKEMEEDLIARAQHLDRLMQVSEANQQAGQKALDEAKQLEKRAEEKLQEVERRKMELREKEKHLIKIKLDIAHEEIRLTRKREQLEHILPPLSSDEALTLQPMKDVIDPKMLIMRLRAEREFEASSKPQRSGKEPSHS